jgi:hypothetical protein
MSHDITPARWGPAVALAVLVASAAVLPRASALALNTQQFDLEFEMAASKPTLVEIYVDRGAGFDANTAMVVPVAGSIEPLPYRVPLPVGRYRAIRLDPFPDEGDLVLQHARVRDRHGRVVTALALSRLEPSASVETRESSDTRLTATALSGHGDPQLFYRFDDDLLLWLSRGDWLPFALESVLIAILVAALGYLFQAADKPLDTLPFLRGSQPRRTIVLTALGSTLVATYPLLVGKSLVTPNNGPMPFVYATPPYAALSTDHEIEDTRGADVRATMWVTMPYAVAQRAALADGEWPWWNRYSQNGVPLLGQAQTAFFDPLQWLVLAGEPAFGADLKFIAGRFVFVAGTGLAAFAATGSFGAALLVTIAAPFISHFLFRLSDPIYFSVVYAPWILVAYAALLLARTTHRLLAAAAGLLVSSALLMFSSSPKEAFAMLPMLHVAGVAAIVMQARGSSEWRRAGTQVAAALTATIGAALLTAPHWLIFLETLSSAFTAYDTPSFEFAGRTQGVALFAGAFVPTLFHAGLNPPLAAWTVIALLRPRQLRDRPLVAGCAIAAACLLILAFGVLPEHWLMPLPMLSRIHHVGATFVTAALPMLLIVAAAGATALGEMANPLYRAHAAIAVAIAGGFASAVFFTADLSHPTIGIALTACIWSGVLVYLVPAIAERPGRVTVAVTAITLATLLLPAGLHLSTNVRILDTLLMQPRPRAALTAVPPELGRARTALDGPSRAAGMNGVLPSGVPTYLSFESITGGDALFSPFTFWMGKQFEPDYFPQFLRPTDPHDQHLAPLLDFWGVRWAVAPPAAESSARLALIERPSAWPRGFFVDRVELHDDRRAFLNRLLSDSRPFASILTSDASGANLPREAQGTAATVTHGRDYRLTANTTSFAVSAPTDGIVILNEGYWPGVTATVDDRATPVFRINETMRGIVVPQGTWRVTFSYRPTSWRMASLMALAGALILFALTLPPALAHARPRPKPVA